MENTQTLNALLKQCFLLPPDQERAIRERWDSLTDDAQKEIVGTLQEMVAKQDDMLMKMVSADPVFPQKLDGFLDRQMASVQASETTKRAGALSSIEHQIDA